MARHPEPPPWAPKYGADGRFQLPEPFTDAPNVGAYDMAAATAMLSLGRELLPDLPEEADAPRAARELGRCLLDTADAVQVRLRSYALFVYAKPHHSGDSEELAETIRGMDLLDRSGGSHVRARDAVSAAARELGSPSWSSLDTWLDQIAEGAFVSLRDAYTLLHHASPEISGSRWLEEHLAGLQPNA